MSVTLLMSGHSLLACAACYGQSDSPLARGMNWGIVTLLGTIVLVLGGVAASFVALARRSSAASRVVPGGAWEAGKAAANGGGLALFPASRSNAVKPGGGFSGAMRLSLHRRRARRAPACHSLRGEAAYKTLGPGRRPEGLGLQ